MQESELTSDAKIDNKKTNYKPKPDARVASSSCYAFGFFTTTKLILKIKIMPQEIKQVKTVQIDFKCPECEDGYLRPNGICLTTHPPKYLHICNSMNCSYSEALSNKIYPYIDYVSDDCSQADA